MAQCFLHLAIVLVVGWNLQAKASPVSKPHRFIESQYQLKIFQSKIEDSIKGMVDLHKIRENLIQRYIMKNTKVLSTHLCSTKFTLKESLGHVVTYFWERLAKLEAVNEKFGNSYQVESKRKEIYKRVKDDFRALRRDLLGNAAITVHPNHQKTNFLGKKMQGISNEKISKASVSSLKIEDVKLFYMITNFFKFNSMFERYLAGEGEQFRSKCKSKLGKKKHKKSS